MSSVDRKRSLEVLRDFIGNRDQKLAEEATWMRDERIDCVLSDAVFLAWCVTLPLLMVSLPLILPDPCPVPLQMKPDCQGIVNDAQVRTISTDALH